MPWCTGCDRFLSPSTVTATGACPRCGATVDPGRARPPDPDPGTTSSTAADHVAPPPDIVAGTGVTSTEAADDETPLPVPWHFKLLVGAIALYLGWRAFQGVEWLAGRF